MKRLLLIALLALASNACATTQPVYHAVDGTGFPPTLIPPMSTFEPATDKATTPRPPAPAEVVIDAASTPSLLQGKLNKQLAPHIKIDWSKQTATAPVAVTKSAPSTEDLKNQVQNLLAQNNSLQNALNDRGLAKLERYARELATTKAELKAAQSELLQQVAKLEQYRRELATMDAELKNARALRDKALDDVISLREKMAIDEKKLERFQTHLQVSIFLLLVLTVFAFFFGLQRGKARAQDFASARITALEGEREKMRNRITALKETHGGALRLRDTLLANCEAHLAEKNKSIDALKDAIKGRDLYIIELREALKRKRARVQDLKRERAGPLPETVDDDPPPETQSSKGPDEGFFERIEKISSDDPPPEPPFHSLEAAFAPLEREEREE